MCSVDTDTDTLTCDEVRTPLDSAAQGAPKGQEDAAPRIPAERKSR
ncbi:hypothetical protein GCM10010275_48080 [Streptomyces litmocidini]|nr:hypothetical protein GCM10010275_48080 [Streptomyces litmocidini]